MKSTIYGMSRCLFFIFLFSIFTNFAFCQTKIDSPILFQGVFLNESRLDLLKNRIVHKTEPTYSAFLALQRTVEELRQQPCHAPEHWYVPGFYRDAEGHEKSKQSLMDDANAAYQLALYFRLTGKNEYALAAARLIDGWATKVKTMSTEDDSTLSFSYHFPALIFAADLIREVSDWPKINQQVFADFVQNRALPMNTMNRDNNWGNWGLVLVMASAAYLREENLFNQGIARWKEFIERQIADDGHLPHEVIRSEGMRGIWYTHFALMPQTLAAEIAYVNGIDLYEYPSPSAHTLRQAFERIVPWTHHPETFQYYKGNPNNLTGTAYISYFEILNARWPNIEASEMLRELRPLSAEHCAPQLTLTHGEPIPEITKTPQ